MNELARTDQGPVYDDKWPRLVVVGADIPTALAEQVIVRTDGGYLHCNDLEWEAAARKIMGLYDFMDDRDESRLDERGYIRDGLDRERESREALGMLDLQYLDNSMIAGAWLGGGTRGWCDWSGKIGCANFNIGKWPSDEDVTKDWKRIARAFPFLDLRSQVVSMCDDDLFTGRVWGTWTVRGGVVRFNDQERTLLDIPPGEKTGFGMDEMMEVMATGGRRITLEALEAVVGRVRRTLPAPQRLAIDG
jgi:hypothetical protein